MIYSEIFLNFAVVNIHFIYQKKPNTMKKIILVLIVSIFGINTIAKAQSYDFTSLIDGNTIYFKIIDNANRQVEIISEIPVPPYYQSQTSKPKGKVIIPDTVINNNIIYSITAIGNYAFSKCSELGSLTLHSNINSIGDYAFKECTSIKSIILPKSISYIGDGTFKDCTSLDSIYFNAENAKNFGTKEALAFEGCKNLKTLVIGEDVKNIPNYAFAGLSSLTSIISNPIIPPRIQGNTFMGVDKTIPVYVYYSSMEDYKKHYFWKEFHN